MNDKKLIGSLNLSFERSYEMPMEHWNLLVAMAQQATLALERTRLFGDTQRSAQEMTSLYHIGLTTTSSLQIDEVLRLIYQQVDRVLHPDTFYIALFEEERHEFRYDLFIENGVTLPPFRARSDSIGITNWVVRNNRPLFVRHWNAEKEQLPFEGSMVGNVTQSIMSVPLVAKNKIVGVMSVQALEPYAFDQTQLRLVTAIASQAALALENAQLHATVNEQAQRDPLTGAYNHGTLIAHLQAAIERAQAAKETVAFIMLDIDRFKQYNDTYGHLIGDDVLRATVEAILSHLKSTDVVGRWGGEEFCVVLPGVTREQARTVAERIKNTVASNVMRDMHNRPIPSATVSQGMAVYSEDAITIEELIHKADTALYAAKARGRNRICDWREMLGNDEPVPFRVAVR
jgi:diguanylate cyclase (GGDEF)-like protein